MTKIDEIEEMVWQMDIIRSFEERGWGLYECAAPISDVQTLQLIVELGREKKSLSYGVRYILLPLAEQDSNWDIIHALTKEVLAQNRGAYFVEFQTNAKGETWPTARMLVDSISLEPPFLLLHIDKRFSNAENPELYKDLDTVEIHLSELWKIRKQLMLALRMPTE